MITTFEPKSPVPQMTTIFIWNLLSVGWKQLSLKSLAAVRQGRDSCTAMSRATLSSRRSSGLDSARQPEPSALVLNEPSCYHFRVFDPGLPLGSLRAVRHSRGCGEDVLVDQDPEREVEVDCHLRPEAWTNREP